ncbi:hypothetical protein K4F52_007514 [Lecanicillium sp. MT-2017a]|nr:hypothetical protein K4F52_007514 [Lecanicillium sp. MT-2017a]
MPSEAKHPAKRRKTSHKMPKPSRSLNTAKFSDEWRRIIRQRASVLKHDMRALYRTVVEDATPEAVLGLAAQIALPESTLQEDAAMQSPPSGWLPAAAPSGSTMPGYDGTRVVDEPFWKQWRKGEKKTGFQARSPLLDMCPEEIYSAQYLRLTREQRTRPKPSPSPPRSSWKRRKDQDQDQRTADADSDSGTDSEVGEEDGSGLDARSKFNAVFFAPAPVTSAHLLQLHAVKADAKAACNRLDRGLKSQSAARRSRWKTWKRSRCRGKGHVPPTAAAAAPARRPSRLAQCWSASDADNDDLLVDMDALQDEVIPAAPPAAAETASRSSGGARGKRKASAAGSGGDEDLWDVVDECAGM